MEVYSTSCTLAAETCKAGVLNCRFALLMAEIGIAMWIGLVLRYYWKTRGEARTYRVIHARLEKMGLL